MEWGIGCRLRELRRSQARQRRAASVRRRGRGEGLASAKHFSNLYAERFGRRPNDYRAPKS
jgi:transcriptional regulator GlxA family with amidase domain